MTEAEVNRIMRVARTERLFRHLTCTIHGHNWHDTTYGTALRAWQLGIRGKPLPEDHREYCMRCGKAR